MTKITILQGEGKRAEIDQPNIVKVTARELFKRDGSSKGYRYTAHLEQGLKCVIRGHATRLYENAFLYNGIIATGKTGLASVFTFGKKPAHYADKYLVTSFAVTLESDEPTDAHEKTEAKPSASTDDNVFAKDVARWLIDHEVPFHYAHQAMSGLHVFTVDNCPNNLVSAFDQARRLAADLV